MAIDKSIYVPLFSELSATMDSAFFHIHPGDVAMLQGFGFQEFKHREDNTELRVEQAACLEMLVFAEDIIEQEEHPCPIMDLRKYQASLIAREIMRVKGCPVSISRGNNIMFLDIPGSYCFTMNDGTALGNARIFMRMYSKSEIFWKSNLFVGE